MYIAKQFIRNEKVNVAVMVIIEQLKGKVRSQWKLRQKAMKKGISDYAFYKAIKELKDQERIKSVQAKGVGNKKLSITSFVVVVPFSTLTDIEPLLLLV